MERSELNAPNHVAIILDGNGRWAKKRLLPRKAGQAIGYKELVPYLQGQATLSDCLDTLKRASRNYAKRQLTWLRRDGRVNWIYYNSAEEFPAILQQVTEILTARGVTY